MAHPWSPWSPRKPPISGESDGTIWTRGDPPPPRRHCTAPKLDHRSLSTIENDPHARVHRTSPRRHPLHRPLRVPRLLIPSKGPWPQPLRSEHNAWLPVIDFPPPGRKHLRQSIRPLPTYQWRRPGPTKSHGPRVPGCCAAPSNLRFGLAPYPVHGDRYCSFHWVVPGSLCGRARLSGEIVSEEHWEDVGCGF